MQFVVRHNVDMKCLDIEKMEFWATDFSKWSSDAEIMLFLYLVIVLLASYVSWSIW